MAKQSQPTTKFIAAALFFMAALFSFATANPAAIVGGIFFSAAALYYLFVGVQQLRSEKNNKS